MQQYRAETPDWKVAFTAIESSFGIGLRPSFRNLDAIAGVLAVLALQPELEDQASSKGGTIKSQSLLGALQRSKKSQHNLECPNGCHAHVPRHVALVQSLIQADMTGTRPSKGSHWIRQSNGQTRGIEIPDRSGRKASECRKPNVAHRKHEVF